jgi:hypothetical protein
VRMGNGVHHSVLVTGTAMCHALLGVGRISAA